MRIKSWLNKHTFLLRLISSTVLIACVPLLMISSILVTNERNGLESVKKEHHTAVAQAVATQMDAYVDAMLAIHYRIIASPSVNPAMTHGTVSDEIQAIQTLHDLQAALPFVKTFGLVIGEVPDILYLSEGKYDFDVFASSYIGVDPEVLSGWLQSAHSKYSFSQSDQFGNYILYVIPAYSSDIYYTSIFVLTKKTLLDALSPMLSEQYVLSAIEDADGTLLYASSAGQQQGTLCTVASSKGISVTLLDTVILSDSLILQMPTLVLFIVLITLLIAVGVALVNYTPLIRLVNSIPREAYAPGMHTNEFSTISPVLSERFRIEKAMSNRLEYQAAQIKDSKLRELLEGHTDSQKDNELFGRHPYFYVLCTQNESTVLLPDVYMVSLENKSMTVYVAFCERLPEINRITETLFLEFADGNARIGLSNPHHDFSQMRLAYVEALTALHASLGPLTRINDVEAPNFCLPDTMPIDFAQLTNGLRTGTGFPVAYANELLDIIEHSESAPAMRRYAYFQVLEQFRRAAQKASVKLDMSRVIFDVTEGSFTSIRNGLIECLNNLRIEQQSEKLETDKMLELRLIRYIDANATDPQMCLGMIADAFHLSAYTVSRLVTSTLGINLNSYLRNKRIDLACSMLQNDEMSIAAVAENVGFSSSSYFISVFKKRMGCTPSEFRKQEKSTELSQRDVQ